MSTTKTELVRKIKTVMDETGLHENERMKLSRELDARGIAPLRGGTWGENSSKLGNFWRINKRLLDDSTQEITESYISTRSTDAHSLPPESAPAACQTPEHESTQTSAYDDSTHGHTLEPATQENTVSDAPVCETGDYSSIQTDLPHESTQSLTETEPEIVGREHVLSHKTTCKTQAHTGIQLDPQDAVDLRELLTWWRTKRSELMTAGSTAQERPLFKRDRTVTKTVRLSDTMAKAAESYARKHRAQTGGTFSGLCEWLIWQALGRPEKFVTQVNIE